MCLSTGGAACRWVLARIARLRHGKAKELSGEEVEGASDLRGLECHLDYSSSDISYLTQGLSSKESLKSDLQSHNDS